mgnify:CR=1 FL=1
MNISIHKILVALIVVTTTVACSPKPTAEDTSAQTKALVDQAVAETKKQILMEQAAEKAKQDALIAEESAAKAAQEAAIAQAVAETKKEFATKQQAEAKAQARKSAATQQVTSTTNAPAAVMATPAPEPVMQAVPPIPKKTVCTTCGIVVSITEVEAEGKGSGLGVVAGGVVGGLLGNQIGNGSGRDLATIAGAIGGAVAGNKIEKNAKKIKQYDITVKMETGETVTFRQDNPPSLSKGDSVKVDGKAVTKK